MFWCRVVFLLSLLFAVKVAGQIPVLPTPTPNPRNVNPIMGDTGGFDRLRSIEMMSPKERSKNHPLLDEKKGIYRRPARKETEALAVSETLLQRYAKFLKAPNTGIIKLNADYSCIPTSDMVVATENCLAFLMPGAGAAFSFRTESYRLLRLADVILLAGEFRTGGILQHVIMANIGDVPIEDVSSETNGIKFLIDLKPASDGPSFTRFDESVAAGIEAGGLMFRKAHAVKLDSTYILRSIAYRGKYIRSIDGIVYNELDYDKRRDVIVAFRVAEIDSNGNVNLVWKRLRDIEAPKLELNE